MDVIEEKNMISCENKSGFVKEEIYYEYRVLAMWSFGIPFVIIGVLFAIFKEKAAKFVSGFNFITERRTGIV